MSVPAREPARQYPREPARQHPDEKWAKASCGCYVGWDGHEWLVHASSFLCDHKQGDHVDGGPPAGGRDGVPDEVSP